MMAGTPPVREGMFNFQNFNLDPLSPPLEHNMEHNLDQSTRLCLIPCTGQVKWLQTILRNKNTDHSDFVFYADRLIRLVVEEALNLLPTYNKVITTPKGVTYDGKAFESGNCGVSIVRSGEAMEKSLRECCRSIRIGKMLIRHEDENMTKPPKVIYVRLPNDIAKRNVLLMYPLMNTGGTIHQGIQELKRSGVQESRIILLTLFVTPDAVNNIQSNFPEVRMLTTEINPDAVLHFGERYFGTDI